MPDVATAPPAQPSAPAAPAAPSSAPVMPSGGSRNTDRDSVDTVSRLSNSIREIVGGAGADAPEVEGAEPAVEEVIQQAEETPAAEAVEAAPVEGEADGAVVEPADDEEIAFDPARHDKTVYAGYKFARELAKPLSEGGIGFTPTVEEARLFFDAYSDRIAMEDKFSSGEPANAADFVNMWFGAQENGQLRQNAEMVAEAIPYVLARNNEAAYGRLAKPVLNGYRNEMWNRWQQAPMEQQPDGSSKPSVLKE